MRKLQLFDPPMCCPTGVCGPNVDLVLLEIQETIAKVSRDFEGEVVFTRHLFGKDLQAFLAAPKVMTTIQAEGKDALPITALDGEVIKTGAYPTYEELKACLERGMADE